MRLARLRVMRLLDRFWIPVSSFDVTPVLAVAGESSTIAGGGRPR